MKQINRPVTSREYKLMLNVDRFHDRDQGAKAFGELVQFLVKRQGGEIVKEQNKPKHESKRITWYLDTPGFRLRQQGLVVRIRDEKEEKEHKITLKYRDSDRYISAVQNVYSPIADKFKFEEDIIPPFVSKFSFDYDLPEEKSSKGNQLEEYPPEVVKGANGLFKAVQKQSGWLNFNATTKTAYAYEL